MYELPDLPKNISCDHPALQLRGEGYCTFLRGKVLLLIVRISDGVAAWDDGAKKRFDAYVEDCAGWMSSTSAAYPRPVQISRRYHDIRLSRAYRFDNEAQRDSILEMMGNSTSASKLQIIFRKRYKVDSVALVFAFNYDIRGHAYPGVRGDFGSGMNEIAYVSATDIDRPVLAHEVFHQYGAVDYYYPKRYEAACLKHFGGSIMNDTVKKVDPLTAYLIGWTDSLSPEAVAFLEETADVTEAEIDAGRYTLQAAGNE